MQTALSNFNDIKLSSTQEKALALLGQGIGTEQVAGALGVTPSVISQFLSDENFKELVSAARFENLQKHNRRDSKLDSLEDKTISKLESAVDLIYKPMELTRVLQVVNAAKRRGSSAPDSIVQSREVVQLIMPVAIMNQYSLEIKTNQINQVIEAGQTSLVTVQSGSMEKLLANHKASRGQNVPILPTPSGSS